MVIVDARTHGFDPTRLSRIDAFLRDRYLETGLLPNAQLLVARDGEVVHFSSQGAARDGGPPSHPATLPAGPVRTGIPGPPRGADGPLIPGLRIGEVAG